MVQRKMKIDPADGNTSTFAKLSAWYRGAHGQRSIQRYWDKVCLPARGLGFKTGYKKQKQFFTWVAKGSVEHAQGVTQSLDFAFSPLQVTPKRQVQSGCKTTPPILPILLHELEDDESISALLSPCSAWCEISTSGGSFSDTDSLDLSDEESDSSEDDEHLPVCTLTPSLVAASDLGTSTKAHCEILEDVKTEALSRVEQLNLDVVGAGGKSNRPSRRPPLAPRDRRCCLHEKSEGKLTAALSVLEPRHVETAEHLRGQGERKKPLLGGSSVGPSVPNTNSYGAATLGSQVEEGEMCSEHVVLSCKFGAIGREAVERVGEAGVAVRRTQLWFRHRRP